MYVALVNHAGENGPLTKTLFFAPFLIFAKGSEPVPIVGNSNKLKMALRGILLLSRHRVLFLPYFRLYSFFACE
jgi:hypothetical protein